MSNPIGWSNIGAGAVTGLVSSGFNHIANALGSDRQMRQQKDLMRYNYKLNERMWHLSNSYNTPAAQMARLRAAGLNPDLMYSNGAPGLQADSPAAVSAGAAPSYAPANASLNLTSDVSALAMANKAGEETIAQSIRNKFLESEISVNIDNAIKTGKLTEAQADVCRQNILESQQNISALKKRVSNETWQTILNTLNTSSEILLRNSQIELNDEQRKYVSTHALAALIGAKGAAEQATAMANAINLFRDPQKLKELISGYTELVSEQFNNVLSNITYKQLQDIKNSIKALAQGDILYGLFHVGHDAHDNPSRSRGGVR